MHTITINPHDYYGMAHYYSVMPPALFEAIEAAVIQGKEQVEVDKDMFEQMLKDYGCG